MQDETKQEVRRSHCLLKRVGKIMFIFVLMLLATNTRATASTHDRVYGEQTLKYQMERVYVYDLSQNVVVRSIEKHLDLKTREEIVGSQENKAQVNTKVYLACVGQDDKGNQRLLMWLEKPQILHGDDNGNLVEAYEEKLQQELERPVFLEQAGNGTIVHFWVHPEEKLSTINIKRGIVSLLQNRLVTLEKGENEEDTSGIYRPEYSFTPDGDNLVITKKRSQNNYIHFMDETVVPNDENSVQLEETVKAVFDKNSLVFSEMYQVSQIYSVPPKGRTVPQEGFCMYSEVFSKGEMKLITIIEGQTLPEISLDEYRTCGLMSEKEDDPEVDASANLVENALDELQKDPLSPIFYANLVKALQCEKNGVDRVWSALNTNRITVPMRSAVLGALGDLGSPAAQHVLIQGIVLAPGMDNNIREQALVALLALKNPTYETMDTLATLSRDKAHPLFTPATLVLGSLAGNLARIRDARGRQNINYLEQELAQAVSDEEVLLFLDALGNAGAVSSVAVIAPYLQSNDPLLRAGALVAMRKMPIEISEPYINNVLLVEQNKVIRTIATRMASTNQEPGDTYISNRPKTNLTEGLDLSPVAWNLNIDFTTWANNGFLKAKLYGELSANDDNNNLNLWAMGDVTGYAWSLSQSLVKMDLLSNLVNQGGQLKKYYRFRFYILNNVVYSSEGYLSCSQSFGGSFTPISRTIFNVSYTFPVLIFPVTLGADVKAKVEGSCYFAFNTCNAPVTAQATGNITPIAWIQATGSVSISIVLIRVGASIYADILKTDLPLDISGKLQTISPTFKACFKFRRNTQYLSGYLNVWAQRRKYIIFGSWVTFYSNTLWNFNIPGNSATFFDFCIPN